MKEQWIMRPGDTFACDECGCSFTVESGPSDEGMVMQAPMCCCGHEMKKQDGGMQAGFDAEVGNIMNAAPAAMAD